MSLFRASTCLSTKGILMALSQDVLGDKAAIKSL